MVLNSLYLWEKEEMNDYRHYRPSHVWIIIIATPGEFITDYIYT